ncbi:MAG: DUF2975 domain-containing protein [Runella slithyformis]|nr:MAG: DUF2975 domain-containing protein [Cytophagales bacterium]TAH09122.1 MAG: DUF2975 domain-containing protein [Runella slithyformis]
MKTRTKQILMVMNVASWLIFLGLCIQTGAVVISFFVSLFVNPAGAQNLYLGLNLSALYQYSTGHYVAMVSFIIFLLASKAFMFYLTIQIFTKTNLVHSFSTDVASLVGRISYVSAAIGLLALVAKTYSDWLTKSGVAVPYNWGNGEFLFLAGIIFIMAQVFKRGFELQQEQDLTI